MPEPLTEEMIQYQSVTEDCRTFPKLTANPQYGDFLVRVAGFAQSNDLHAALVPRFAAQRSHVGCLHESELRVVQKISSAQGPD